MALFAVNGSLWVAWIKKNIINGRVFWSTDFQYSGSWIWRRLMKLHPLAQPYLSCQVRSGNLAMFWHDDWIGLGALIDLTGELGPRVSGSMVSQACDNGVWSLLRGCHPILIILRACLPLDVPGAASMEDDFFLWRNALQYDPCIFSTSKTWLSLNPVSSIMVPWYKSVWFIDIIPNHSFMSWITLRDMLPTRDRLSRWGINVPTGCLLCGSSIETKSHLFFDCSYSSEVWLSFFTIRILQPPALLVNIVDWVMSPSRNKKLNIICKLVFHDVSGEKEMRDYIPMSRNQFTFWSNLFSFS